MFLLYIIHSLFEYNGFIIHNTFIILIPNGECNYLLSGKLPTVRQSYLLSGKLPTVRHAPNRSIDMHPKGIDMHPKVSIDLHPTTAYFAPNNRIHAPNRSIDMHPTSAYMHPKVSIYMHPTTAYMHPKGAYMHPRVAAYMHPISASFTKFQKIAIWSGTYLEVFLWYLGVQGTP